jgi:hypothetical protein
MSGSCARCGETWDRDPRLEVECPECKAGVGQVCRRPSGHNVFGQPHVAREQLAVDRGVLSRECPTPVPAETRAAR